MKAWPLYRLGLFTFNERRSTMNREILEKPFGPEQIKQREGNFGRMLDYIEGHAVIQRLNDAFEACWGFEILDHKILEKTDEVVVIGKLTAGSVVKTQFGSSRITRAKETKAIISLADDLKAACTDALKKCATMLGVGLHLYNRGATAHPKQNGNGGNGHYTRQPENDNLPSEGHRNGGNGNGNGHQQGGNGKGGNGNGDDPPPRSDSNGRLSGKQYKFLLKLAAERGRNKADLDRSCLKAYGCGVEFLSKQDASALISSMTSN
jgi:hypothetical protein